MHLPLSLSLFILSLTTLTSALPAPQDPIIQSTNPTSTPTTSNATPSFECVERVTTADPAANDCQNALLQMPMSSTDRVFHQAQGGDLPQTLQYGRCRVTIGIAQGQGEQSDTTSFLALQHASAQLSLTCAKVASSYKEGQTRTGGRVMVGEARRIQIAFSKLPRNVSGGQGEVNEEGDEGRGEGVSVPGEGATAKE